MQVVKVEWLDSAHIDRPWAGRDETCSPVACTSIGYVVEKTKNKVVLAGDYTDHQWGRMIAIPRAAIKKMKAISEVK